MTTSQQTIDARLAAATALVLVIVMAAVSLASVAAAGPGAAKQRVAITTKGSASIGEFVLTPLHAGVLRRDSGTESCDSPSERIVMREGQRVAVYDPIVCTEKGKRGSLVTRSRIEYVDAGNGYHVGTGTWKVVRGTGQYAQITGGGRRGDVYLDSGPWSGRNEGFLYFP